MTHILQTFTPHLRMRAVDTGAQEGIEWLLHTWWRNDLNGRPMLAHTRVLMGPDAGQTHDGGSAYLAKVLADPTSMAKRDAQLGVHPHGLCPSCGGWAVFGMTTAGNRGAHVFTSVATSPWSCPMCVGSFPLPNPGPDSLHAKMGVEQRWRAYPKDLRW